MRALAARAGVSLATPYHLFGSQRAIVLAVLQDVREFHERFSILHTTDPLERVFVAMDMEVECYVVDPDFYKVMWSAVFDTTDDVRSTLFNPRRDAFWLGLIDDAGRAGALLEGVDARLLLQQLDHMHRSVMLDWIHGELDLALLRRPCATASASSSAAPRRRSGVDRWSPGCLRLSDPSGPRKPLTEPMADRHAIGRRHARIVQQHVVHVVGGRPVPRC